MESVTAVPYGAARYRTALPHSRRACDLDLRSGRRLWKSGAPPYPGFFAGRHFFASLLHCVRPIAPKRLRRFSDWRHAFFAFARPVFPPFVVCALAVRERPSGMTASGGRVSATAGSNLANNTKTVSITWSANSRPSGPAAARWPGSARAERLAPAEHIRRVGSLRASRSYSGGAAARRGQTWPTLP